MSMVFSLTGFYVEKYYGRFMILGFIGFYFGFIGLTLSAPFIPRSFVLVIPNPTKIPRRQTRPLGSGVRFWVAKTVYQG